jgi:chromosome segregation protein
VNHVNSLHAAFSDISNRLQFERDIFNRKSTLLDSLKEFENQLTGYSAGVKTLLLAGGFKNAFNGMVADYIEVDEVCEPALEAVLGEKLQYLLYSREDDVINAVGYLRESSGGRCTFIPYSGGQSISDEPLPEVPRLLEKISVADGCRAFVEQVLCRTYLADDLLAACKLSKDFPRAVFVTAQGDMVYSAGIISGGSSSGAQLSIISNKREIKDLDRDVSDLLTQIVQLEKESEDSKSEITLAENAMNSLQQQSHLIDMQLLTTEKDLFRMREESQRIVDLKAVRSIDNEQLMDEKILLENEVAAYVSKLALEDEIRRRFELEADNLQRALQDKKVEIHGDRELLTSLKVRIAELQGKCESNELTGKKIAQLKADMQVRIAANQAEVVNVALERERLSGSITECEGQLKQLAVDLAKKELSAQILKERYEAENLALREDESLLKLLTAQSVRVNEEITARRLKISEIQYQLHHLETSIFDKYRIDITSALGEYSISDNNSHDDAAVRQSELQKLIDDMGEVNLMAIEEYQSLEERLTFLTTQKEDLETSLQSLQKAIQKINRTTRQKFLGTFQLINAKFQEVFPRLFCGGQAELRLTNEEDIVETGIDIVVQPPGKKLQNVTLLSGGEKALTAVALIFAIFLVKPSPFCLLDEVDAPLDDANIGRFNEMVREMSNFSQFIIITHNKATMSVVDTLYGVTMEEPGISKIVSVKLN